MHERRRVLLLQHRDSVLVAIKDDNWPRIKRHIDKIGHDHINDMILVPRMHPTDGQAPLLVAAAYWSADAIVSRLLEAGADANAQDAGGHTALYYAIINNDELSVRALLEKGADINLGEGHSFWNRSLARAYAERMGNDNIIQAILEYESRER